MRAPLRIAILECGNPGPKAKIKYHGYGGMFEILLSNSAKALNQPERLDPETGLEFSKWDVVKSQIYPRMDDIDAVLLTGSKYNAFDDIPWINRLVGFLQQILAQDRIRILGICFGHQILGRALGAKVGQTDQDWEISVCDMDLTDKGKQLFGLEKIRIQQMHRDIVFSCPSEATLLGYSPLCAVQAMYASRRFITIQGHPEFNGEIQAEIILNRKAAGVFNEAQTRDGLERVHNTHDGLVVGKTFLEFLLEE